LVLHARTRCRGCGPVHLGHLQDAMPSALRATPSNNPLAELVNLPYHDTVDEYQEPCPTCMAHTGQLSPQQLVQLFTDGLLDHIRVELCLASSKRARTQPQRWLACTSGREREREKEEEGGRRRAGSTTCGSHMSGINPTKPYPFIQTKN
jgi:hypothetical protein